MRQKSQNKNIPAKTRKQRKLFGIALAIKRGELSASYSPEAARLAREMTEEQLRDFAKTKEKGLPTKKGRKKYKVLYRT